MSAKLKRMKLSIKILFLTILIMLFCQNSFSAFASQESLTYYARVMENGVAFYQSPTDDDVIFVLPKSYFVELLDTSGDYYYARYIDILGYVKKDEVKAVVGTPSSPFLKNISFRVFVPSGANLRSSPKNSGANNLICSIPFLDSNISYYGEIEGEESISKKGTTWYYCKYYNNNSLFVGYVYAPLCDCVDTITENTEELEYMQGEPSFSLTSVQTSTDPMTEMSQTAQTLIIVAISLPCLLFIYLLFKPTMIAETKSESGTKTKRQKKKISRLKKSDYFEFNDDDLN